MSLLGVKSSSMTSPTIGLLGGGQLGLMLCEAAAPLNIPIAILDAADSPAKKINSNPHHVTGSYKDAAKIRALATHADILTVETEHIDTHILEEIATQGVQVRAADGTTTTKMVAVHPSWRTLRLIQNKYEQKEYFAQRGIPVAEQVAVEAGEAMLASMEMVSRRFGYPWMLKARRDSYDGRGNMIIRGQADLVAAAMEFRGLECYAERWVPFESELSVVVIRTENDDGSTRSLTPYPVVETVHEDSVCSRVYFPPRRAGVDLCHYAQDIACSVVDKLWGRGVFAVEMFVTEAGDVLVNEVAPRPHNSGHLFIEAVPYMSQYKAQLAAILNDPLPVQLDPLVHSSVMINILGGARPDSHLPLVKAAKGMFADNIGVYLHLYGKEAKPGRKIGHITLAGLVGLDVLERVAQPLVDLAEAMRQERLQAASAALRPEQAQPAAAVGNVQQIKREQPLVLVTMGSDSDLPVLRAGIDVLNHFGVPWEVDITSAHRTPAKMARVASEAAARGIKVIIAAAGGAAHLPGMLAAYTPLPVIGVPVKATHLDGIDSLLSIVQMPRGVPTATVAINNSTNAALLAIRILGAFMPDLLDRMKEYQQEMEGQVEDKADLLQEMGVEAYLGKMGK